MFLTFAWLSVWSAAVGDAQENPAWWQLRVNQDRNLLPHGRLEVVATPTVRPTQTPTPTPTTGWRRPTEPDARAAFRVVPTVPPALHVVVDLDIDSDNSGILERSAEEDAQEGATPGKLVITHGMDTDYDGIPDFADGFEDSVIRDPIVAFDGSRPGASGAELTPVVLSLQTSQELPASAAIQIACSSPSDSLQPESIAYVPEDEAYGGYFVFQPAPFGGHFRLWTRGAPSLVRDARPYRAGGDLLSCGDEIAVSDFEDGVFRFYIEGIERDEVSITASLVLPAIDDAGRPLTLAEHSETADTVRFSLIRFDVEDLRTRRAQWNADNVEYGAGQLTLSEPLSTGAGVMSRHNRVEGALVDGASLVRLVGATSFAPEARAAIFSRMSVRIDPVSGVARANEADVPQVFGGLHPVFSPEGQLTLPPIPMPRFSVTSHGLHRKQPLLDGTLFYLPPRNFVAATSVLGTGFSSGDLLSLAPDEEVATVAFSILYRVGEDPRSERVIGSVPFRLRRPPLVLVHGLHGQGGGAYWDPAVWDESNPALATRLYFGDYRATNMKGYSENLFVVPYTINRALYDYWYARDDVHPGGLSPGDRHSFQRSFRRMRYAATRVDVVGHSMGGQLTRAYISNVSGQFWRGGTWAVLDFRRGGISDYFGDQNLGAGTIRRFFPVGSPFLGSPIAAALEPAARPYSPLNLAILQWAQDYPNTFGELMVQLGVLEPAMAGSFSPTFPTAVVDLSPQSVAQRLLEDASYPHGDKAVMWYPITGFAEIHEGSAELPWGAGMFWDLTQCGRLVLNPLVASWIENLVVHRELGPSVSDYVVAGYSQRNAQVRGEPDDDTLFRRGTPNLQNWNIGATLPRLVHSVGVGSFRPICEADGQSLFDRFGDRGLMYQTSSSLVAQKIGEALLATDDLAETGATQLNPGGSGGLQSEGLGRPY